MRFLSPYHLLLLLTIPALYFLQKRQGTGHIKFSALKGINAAVSPALRIRNYLKWLSYVILSLVVIASARPQVSIGGGNVPSEGIDMVMIIDVSGSMKTIDSIPLGGLKPEMKSKPQDMETRLDKVKRISRQFVKNRKEDRIGIIAFAGHSVIVSPLTQDYKLLDRQIAALDFNLITDGTALGMVLVSGINMLKDSERKEKAVIVLTDGLNNAGEIEPIQAAYLAKSYNVKIYAIEMGSFAENEILREQSSWEGVEHRLLDKMSRFTSGKHFVIPDSGQLYEVFNEIEKSEKSKVDLAGYADYVEIYPQLVLAAAVLLVMQIVLLNTRYRKIP
ncbi:MAG: VWA domain-containing protein [Nitrospinae bacterium]|nr:VWA domain-containing protein [Nitrospinota bacterium]